MTSPRLQALQQRAQSLRAKIDKLGANRLPRHIVVTGKTNVEPRLVELLAKEAIPFTRDGRELVVSRKHGRRLLSALNKIGINVTPATHNRRVIRDLKITKISARPAQRHAHAFIK
jgi:hypothetical protein